MRQIQVTVEQWQNGIDKGLGYTVKELFNTDVYKIGQRLTDMEIHGLLLDDSINIKIIGKV